MTDPTELRDSQRDRWEAAAPGWDERADTVRAAGAPVAEWLVDAAGTAGVDIAVPKPGGRVVPSTRRDEDQWWRL